jgi:hypothetical protein
MILISICLLFWSLGHAVPLQSNVTDPIIDLGYASYRGVLNVSTGLVSNLSLYKKRDKAKENTIESKHSTGSATRLLRLESFAGDHR